MLSIKLVPGAYIVTVTGVNGTIQHQVTKDKRCSCGEQDCAHIDAVAAYLRAGGVRASKAPPDKVVSFRECPICQEVRIILSGGMWTCSVDGSHYFIWRDQISGGAIKEWLTGGWEKKLSQWYG